jgi:hypothetical protein
VLVGSAVAAVAALAVAWVVGRGAGPEGAGPATAVRPTPLGAAATFGGPPAHAALVWGETGAPVSASALPTDAPFVIDLDLPVAIDPGADVLASRILTLGRPPLELDGAVGGAARDVVRLEVPPGWLAPGSYLIEVRTTERNPLPLRRFALIVE